jgi:hypothetical protein
LNTILSQYIHEDNPYRGDSNLTPGEVVLRLLETRKNKMKEIEDENKKFKERMVQLISGTPPLPVVSAAEATIASSSTPSLMSPPLLFSTGATNEAQEVSMGQSPAVARRRKVGDELNSV